MTGSPTLSIVPDDTTHIRRRSATLQAPASLGRVAWSRGPGCFPLAEQLAATNPVAIDSDLARTCIEERIDLLVTRRLNSFDLVSQVAPSDDVDLRRVLSITAAIGDGPHSPLAAAIADRLAMALGVPGELATVYRDLDELPAAVARIERLGSAHPALGRRVARAESAAGLMDTLTPATLLVTGAPGGSWFQRQLLGPGPSLAERSPGGVVVVRYAPPRCFHATVDAAGYAVGPELSVADARCVVTTASAPVARLGRLVGVVRSRTLATAPDDALVGDVMEVPVAVRSTEPLEAIDDLRTYFESGPIPVVDDRTRLVGVVPGMRQEVAA